MRITNTMLSNNMMNYISNNLNRMDKLQSQLATGKKIQIPSDDPVVAARALKLRTDVSEVEQYKRNVQDAQSWLDITDATLEKINAVFQRGRELAVQAANGTNTPDDTRKIEEEVKQLKSQIVHLGNTTYAGRYIFSGFRTDQRLMEEDGTFAITSNNNEKIKFEIGIGDDIDINIAGGDLFNNPKLVPADPDDTTSGSVGTMINDINNFITALDTGNQTDIGNSITRMDENIKNLLRIRADVGARQNRLELTANRLDSDYINFTKLMSENEDVDEAETIMNLKNEENVYRASLAGGARIIQPSLVDFLR
ncbi:MAG: flagellar hook-associated protein FlgL [Clostridia bacterium]|nr:flagellar hook-associated protein FlgL [Clostridia bacterium]